MITEKAMSTDDLLKQARNAQIALNVTPDYKYYILMTGIFNPKRSMVNHWAKYAPVFTKLASNDGEDGMKRVFQAIILFFVRAYPDMKNQAATFMKILYDNSFYSSEFFTSWAGSSKGLDKNSCMAEKCDKKCEKEMKTLCKDFIEYIATAEEYGDYDEEDAGGEEEQKQEESAETGESDAAKRQRELVAKQMAA